MNDVLTTLALVAGMVGIGAVLCLVLDAIYIEVRQRQTIKRLKKKGIIQ